MKHICIILFMNESLLGSPFLGGSGGRIGSAIQKIYPMRLMDLNEFLMSLEDFPVTLVGEVVRFSRS